METGSPTPPSLRRNQGYSESFVKDDFEDHLSAYPLHTSTSRSHFGTTDSHRGYITIISLFLIAVLTASINHVIFSRIDGELTGSHTSQFWVSTLKNVFPSAVALQLIVVLKCCLSQVALYRIRLGSYPISLVSLMASEPSFCSTISILFKSSMRASILGFVLLAAITQAATLTSIFIPGTLTVTQSPSVTTSLGIPTIDFNVVDPTTSSLITVETDDPPTLSFQASSPRWQQLILRAASEGVAPTWDVPSGCGISCNYTFTYSAPAVSCTALSREDIWPGGGTNTTGSLLAFPLNSTLPTLPDSSLNEYFFYNSTYAFTTPDENNPNVSLSTLDVIYIEGFNTTLAESLSLSSQYPDPTQYNPLGTHCEYQNATYEATTVFSNNTQSSSTRVMQMTGSLPIGHDADDSTQALNTPLFSLTSAIQNSSAEPGESATMYNAFFFGLSPMLAGNLSSGIQDLLGNVTLAFVSEQMASTLATVTVTPNSTQYQYHAQKLGLIYGIVFGVSLMLVFYGLVCLRKNGSTAVFDLEHIVEMTSASKDLHESAVHPHFGSTPLEGVMLSDGVFKLDVHR
ncbi:hypothetical protein BT96DRAFT_978567 [Gymnopus androsaceus JB14]|uniref:Uncharacterized protein n=1 Tax=Gymnopus androsaceus JB14 TaxID=1447944 RepID=A0A6A4HAS1_9AGAR|nr:hypothetical protein BT96DRAFT_978567 [Gymnopus androsaceus JB14]